MLQWIVCMKPFGQSAGSGRNLWINGPPVAVLRLGACRPQYVFCLAAFKACLTFIRWHHFCPFKSLAIKALSDKASQFYDQCITSPSSVSGCKMTNAFFEIQFFFGLVQISGIKLRISQIFPSLPSHLLSLSLSRMTNHPPRKSDTALLVWRQGGDYVTLNLVTCHSTLQSSRLSTLHI